jgi:hypothetical protein
MQVCRILRGALERLRESTPADADAAQLLQSAGTKDGDR